MAQTPDNNSSSRLDRIEAILERSVADREADRLQMNELREGLAQLAQQTVADREVDRLQMNQLREGLAQLAQQTVADREADRQQTNELRETLAQQTTQTGQQMNQLRETLAQLATQTVADREADRLQMNELREALTQLTRRFNNFIEITGRYQEQNDVDNSELQRGQTMINDLIRLLTLGQGRMEQAIQGIQETQASLAAAQERQERILDYLIRRSE